MSLLKVVLPWLKCDQGLYCLVLMLDAILHQAFFIFIYAQV